jgi:CelD/BcsL family acetyltransferase involved in cellulose biosynthesis
MSDTAVQIESAPHTVEVVRDADGIEALGPAWRALQWHYNADIDFYRTLMRSRSTIVRPHVVALSRNERPAAILAGRLEEGPFECKLGYRSVYAPRVRALVVPYGGIMGDRSPEVTETLLRAVQDALAGGEADLALFAKLPMTSALFRQARRIPGFLSRDRFETASPHHRLRLGGSFESFLKSCSRNSRENVRRYSKRLLKKFGDRLAVKCLRREDQLDELARDVGAIVPKTYQAGLGVGFLSTPEERELVALAARRGWLRAYVLTIAGKPVAFWPGYQYDGTFFVAIPGYDPTFRDYRVGNFLLMKVIEESCSNEAVQALDFGFGDAQYKRSFSNEHWNESDLCIFAPTMRGVRLNAIRSAIGAIDRSARWCLSRTELLQRVKTRWRERLRPPTPSRT